LAKVVARRDLSTEGITTPIEPELIEIVWTRLHQNGYANISQSYRVCNALFISEVWKADEDAVQTIAIAPQQVSALLRIGPSLDSSELRILLRKPNGLD
jgi:hypothetical protein